MLHEIIRLQAPDILTALPSVEWIHRGHGQEGQSRIQEDGWISKCSSESIIAAELLHGWPTQGAVMPRRHRPINIQRIR